MLVDVATFRPTVPRRLVAAVPGTPLSGPGSRIPAEDLAVHGESEDGTPSAPVPLGAWRQLAARSR